MEIVLIVLLIMDTVMEDGITDTVILRVANLVETSVTVVVIKLNDVLFDNFVELKED